MLPTGLTWSIRCRRALWDATVTRPESATSRICGQLMKRFDLYPDISGLSIQVVTTESTAGML